jgi:xanthine dehydrogenase YagT iron-sulfur-binding subunit
MDDTEPPCAPGTGPEAGATPPEEHVQISLRVNGEMRELRLDPRTTLLDALRGHLGLHGSKKACDHGQCGACTVHVNGHRILSCLSLAVMHQGDEITTIEGLSAGEELHPMQQAFIDCDALQCGYCTPGQIMSAAALIEEAGYSVPSHVTPDVAAAPSLDELSDAEIRERMSGNICRCGAYPNIVAAVRLVRDRRKGGQGK